MIVNIVYAHEIQNLQLQLQKLNPNDSKYREGIQSEIKCLEELNQLQLDIKSMEQKYTHIETEYEVQIGKATKKRRGKLRKEYNLKLNRIKEELKLKRKKELLKRKKKQRRAEIMMKLRDIGKCVAGYEWIYEGNYFRCAGGSHTVSLEEVGIKSQEAKSYFGVK